LRDTLPLSSSSSARRPLTGRDDDSEPAEVEDDDDDEDKKTPAKPARGGKRKASKSPEADVKDKKEPVKKVKADQEVKVVTQGGAAVDKLFNVPNCHVYIDGKEVFTKTLNQSNLDRNNNKFYIIQLLEGSKKDEYFVFNRWGRVGYDGQMDVRIYDDDVAGAIKDYNKPLKLSKRCIEIDRKKAFSDFSYYIFYWKM